MAEERAKEGGGDSKNEEVFPGVNDSKGKTKVEFPSSSSTDYILLEMVCVLKEVKPFLNVAEAMWLLLICDLNVFEAVEHGIVNTNPVLFSRGTSKHSQCENDTPRGSSSKASGAGRKGLSGLRQKAHRAETRSKGGKRRGAFITRMNCSVDVTMGKPLISQLSSSGGKKNKGSGVVSVSSLPAVTSKAVAVVKQESKPTVKAPGSSAIPSSVHISEKDERIVTLMVRKQLLQQELEGWTDWASVKVREAAQKLSKEQTELKKLRQEREETHNFEALMEEKVKQRQSELEGELSGFHAQMGLSNSAVQRLEAERAKLKKGIADSLMKSIQSCVNLEETVEREQELLKQCQTLEGETSSLQEYLAGLKGESASLQARIDKAKKREGEFEREKIKNLQKLESIRSKREQWKRQVKAEEDNLRAKATANRLQYEERKSKLIEEISALKLAAASGGVKREWEFTICLTKEPSIAFLPCAHQVLCKDCNML
ncbi:putative E3 ubiquitin-protein ligase RF298 [Ipomoea triloba]|uniref:putative E3 ubiquitin-protein ligase RF298 n=1 Tax=Ipomoea triloba TaxID=35885 RepID=UPI00125E3814|nr:putative E3 ubiquitin-protein ligase RF298 [Ipomoea triloba]